MKTAVVVSVGRTAVLRQIGAGDDHTSICCTSPPAPTATASIRVGSSSGARELFTRRDTGQHCNTSLAAGFRSSRPAAPVSATLPEAAKTAEQTTASVGGWNRSSTPRLAELGARQAVRVSAALANFREAHHLRRRLIVGFGSFPAQSSSLCS
jgi:hypothetical protein